MIQDSARSSLNLAIEALLDEGPIDGRLSNAACFIAELEQYRSAIPDECFNMLKDIVGQLTCFQEAVAQDQGADGCLSAEEELALSEELLSLYITASGGSLVF